MILDNVTPFAKVYTDEAVQYDKLGQELRSQGRKSHFRST